METIGVRELRRYASRWLSRVKAGETIVVTDRGRPVAQLVPVGEGSGYDKLVAEGRIALGSGLSLRQVMEEVDADTPPDDGPSVTDELLRLRADDR